MSKLMGDWVNSFSDVESVLSAYKQGKVLTSVAIYALMDLGDDYELARWRCGGVDGVRRARRVVVRETLRHTGRRPIYVIDALEPPVKRGESVVINGVEKLVVGVEMAMTNPPRPVWNGAQGIMVAPDDFVSAGAEEKEDEPKPARPLKPKALTKDENDYLRGLVRMDLRKRRRALERFQAKPGQDGAEADAVRAHMADRVAFIEATLRALGQDPATVDTKYRGQG